MTFTAAFTSGLIICPFNFRADEFISCYTAAEFGSTLKLHSKRRGMWTTGDALFIDCIINIFKMCSGI